jgi:hypothetical protein
MSPQERNDQHPDFEPLDIDTLHALIDDVSIAGDEANNSVRRFEVVVTTDTPDSPAHVIRSVFVDLNTKEFKLVI